MADVLKMLVQIIARIHNYIIKVADHFMPGISDKWLHFLVIGLLGTVLVLILYPLFKELAERKLYLITTFVYVFTLLVVFTFAIEIGQKITSTGNMEFADIVAGLSGFLCMFIVLMIPFMIKRAIDNHRNRA